MLCNRVRQGLFGALILSIVALAGCTTTMERNSPASPVKAVEDHVRLGLNYIGDGNRSMARYHILKALDIDSKAASAHNAMALLLQVELEKDLAEEHFKKAISYDKTFTPARNNYGVFLFQEGRYDDAYKQFTTAAKDVNYDLRPQVFYSLGVTAGRLGKIDKAEEAFTRAIALNPRYAQPYLELAEHYYLQKDFKNARNYLNEFDKLARTDAKGLWLAVRLADHFGDKDRMASKGLALEKLFPHSRENLEYQKWLKHDAK
jgi:type IV pilus assembly protein PilF